jgi:anti-repressor protein
MDNKEVQVYESKFGKVRVVMIDGVPWFVGKDIAECLGYADTFGALKKHVDDEDKQNCQNDSFESPRGLTVVNESGMYSLALFSKLPTAKPFRRWITSEVVPSIRKTGSYSVDSKPLSLEEQMAQGLIAANKLIAEKNKQIEVMKPKALFADAVSSSRTSILIRDLAKLIKQNGIDIGQNRLYEWLRDKGYLIKKGSDKNMPTQKAMNLNLFEIKVGSYINGQGANVVTRTPKVTGKGQVYFVNKFLGN